MALKKLKTRSGSNGCCTAGCYLNPPTLFPDSCPPGSRHVYTLWGDIGYKESCPLGSESGAGQIPTWWYKVLGREGIRILGI